jgi:pilus assembly protein CpaE
MSTTVLVVGSKNGQIEDLLEQARLPSRSVATTDLAALADPAAPQPDVLLIDLRDESSLPVALTAIKRQHPATGVVLIASALDTSLLMAAMRAGVSEVVTEVTPTELASAIERVASMRSTQTSGDVFAFVGAKGGVGTTTVAVNTAAALAKLSRSRVLLIDLHLAYGDAALFLGAEPRFSVLDALENTRRLDQAFFKGLVTRTDLGVDLLASSDRAAVGPVDAARVRAVIDVAARQYRYIVVDVARADMMTLDALDSAKAIIVVANQELSTVRGATRIAGTLRQRYGKDRIRVVISRYDAQSEIGQDDVERTIGVPVKHTFPSDYRLALKALNQGRPIALDNHNALSGSVQKFARELAGVAETPRDKPGAGGGLFGRWGRKG